MKRCSKCAAVKPLSEFYPYPYADGRRPDCKDCKREGVKRNIRARSDHYNAYTKAYRAANREVLRERQKAWRETHWSAYYAKNEAKLRAKWERRKRALEGATVEPVDRDYIIARDSSRCHICGEKVAPGFDLTLDHLVPISKGGDHSHLNVRVAHRSCNSRRHDGRLPAQLLLVA